LHTAFSFELSLAKATILQTHAESVFWYLGMSAFEHRDLINGVLLWVDSCCGQALGIYVYLFWRAEMQSEELQIRLFACCKPIDVCKN
jgi:hypothetical protein